VLLLPERQEAVSAVLGLVATRQFLYSGFVQQRECIDTNKYSSKNENERFAFLYTKLVIVFLQNDITQSLITSHHDLTTKTLKMVFICTVPKHFLEIHIV
jgi:hypothetical protein